MFGVVNTIFSGFAFAGVVYAILLQRRELELQRRELMLQRLELRLTREELRRSAEAQEGSEKALLAQAQALALSAKINSFNIIPALIAQCSPTTSRLVILNNTNQTTAFDISILAIRGYVREDASKIMQAYDAHQCGASWLEATQH
jgi:hypothetical protein